MAAIAPTIWTADQFKTASTPDNIFKRHRGTEIQLIDQTLVRVDALRHQGASDQQKHLAIHQIVVACKNWLNAKGNKTTAAATKRKEAVESLGEQAFQWIKWYKFHERKSNRPPGFANLRDMRPGYKRERDLYVASAKRQNPVSGSYVHAIMESREHEQFAGRTFANLTMADFRQLDNASVGEVNQVDPMGDPGSMAKVKMPRMVLFLNKQERIKRLVIVQNGLLYEGFDKPLNASPAHCVAYVIDKYGNIYSSTETFDKRYSFNHSTFNAGKEVICAGTLGARQGQLALFTNNSGHYKPTRQNMHDGLRFIENAEIDLSHTVVWVNEPDPARPGKLINHEYRVARTFLNNINAVPDLSTPEP